MNDEEIGKIRIVSNNADTEGDLALVAKKLYDEGNYEQALKVYSDMLLYSADSDLYVKMGNCFDKLDKGQTAIEYWEKAISLDNLNSNAFINLGNYYYKKNQYEKAISYWISTLVCMPEEPTANLNLAVVYTIKNMHMEAFWYYQKYLKYAQDKTTDKYKQVQEKIEKNKKIANDYLKLGVQYQANLDKISALKCYLRALKHCPIFSKIHLNLGALYYEDKNYEEAIKHWSNAEYLDPNYPKILSNLGISYELTKNYDNAYCYYTRYANCIAGSNPAEYDKIIERCHKLKPTINANPHLIKKHLTNAEEAFAECNYYKAISEYRKYIILVPEEQPRYAELIMKIDGYMHPEQAVIQSCSFKGKKLMSQENYFDARQYFARILVLADSNSIDYTDAKRKLSICLQQH